MNADDLLACTLLILVPIVMLLLVIAFEVRAIRQALEKSKESNRP